MWRIRTDPRYGFSKSLKATARTFGLRVNDFKRKASGVMWIYPSELPRIERTIEKIRSGSIKLKCTREWAGRKIYDAVVVDSPIPPVNDLLAVARLDFRGANVGMIPAAPPARRMRTPQGVFGRAAHWTPRERKDGKPIEEE